MRVDLSNLNLWQTKYLPAVYDPKTYNVLWGGAGCFAADQTIITNNGSKPISEIQQSDMVLSYNHDTNQNELKEVKTLFEYQTHADRLIEIKMKDGTIIQVTENHKFFFGGSYVKIKDILVSLKYEK